MYEIPTLTILRERRARRARSLRLQRRLQFELDRDAVVRCFTCRMIVPANTAHTCPATNAHMAVA